MVVGVAFLTTPSYLQCVDLMEKIKFLETSIVKLNYACV